MAGAMLKCLKPGLSGSGLMPARPAKNHSLTEPNMGWLLEKVLSLPGQCSQMVVASFSIM